MPSLFADLFALSVCSLALWYGRRRAKRERLPYPPGPPGLPLVGNVVGLPKEYEWETYAEWSRQYDSPLVHVSIMGQHIVIVNDAAAALELFDKRSSIYSDRPQQVMLGELCGLSRLSFSFMPYGERWRARRRIFHHYFHPEAAKAFRPREVLAAHELLHRLLQTPEEWFAHLRHAPGQLILSIAYGIRTRPSDDPYISMVEEANKAIIEAGIPGTYLVDAIPILKYLPDWCAKFKQQARRWRELTEKVYMLPFRQVKDALAMEHPGEGAVNSVAGMALSKIEEDEDREEIEDVIRSATGVMYGAGSDTISGGLKWFFLAMLLRPDVQKAAQSQIDQVAGRDRLPEFADQECLPLVSAITKEILRWGSMVPLGVPHQLTEDDIYMGYHIPKNSIIVGNSWAMLHDEEVYGPDVMSFNPYRFLDGEGHLNPAIRDPTQAFGFGRRICLGRFMAYDSLWIQFACILATFNITKPVDANGRVVEPTGAFASGLVIELHPFRCAIKPRGKEAERLIIAGKENDV